MAKIRIERDFHDLYKKLGGDDEAVERGEAPFATMKEVFMLSVVLGANKRDRLSLTNPREVFDESVLKPRDLTILRAIALAESRDINILQDDAAILKMAQEYANTGIRIIRDRLEETEPIQSISHLFLS